MTEETAAEIPILLQQPKTATNAKRKPPVFSMPRKGSTSYSKTRGSNLPEINVKNTDNIEKAIETDSLTQTQEEAGKQRHKRHNSN